MRRLFPARSSTLRRLGAVLPMLLATLLLILSLAAAAQRAGEPQSVAQTLIGGQALAGSQGVVTVNMAAGDFNFQAIGAAIAANLDRQEGMGLAEAYVDTLQHHDALRFTVPDVATSAIQDGAFQNAVGLISVNQASGVANAQANEFALTLGFSGADVSDDALGRASSNAGPVAVEPGPARLREVSVAETSFRGAQGVAQVTQTAGSWNATSNSFALRISVDANTSLP